MIKDDFESFCKNYLDLTPEISFSVSVGGYSGGNCYGDKAKQFNKDESDILDEIKSNLQSTLNYLSPHFVSDYLSVIDNLVNTNGVDGYTSSKSDSSDYYGNSYDYHTYSFDIKEIFNSILKTSADKELFSQCVDEHLSTTNKNHQVQIQKNEIKKVEVLIKNFDKTKNAEKKKLQKRIADSNKVTKTLSEQLANFDSDKDKELEHLKSKLSQLTTSKTKKNKP